MSPDGGLIRAVRIGCDLNPANDTFRHVSNKIVCVAVIPLARQVAHNELFAGSDGQIGVLVAAQFIIWRCAALADSNTRP